MKNSFTSCLFYHLLFLVYEKGSALKLPKFLDGKLRNHQPPVQLTNTSEPIFAPLVRVGIYIESLGRFYSSEMSFDADFYIYCNWREPKLQHSSPNLLLINNPEFLDTIWRPDLYLANSRNSKLHNIFLPNFSVFVDQEGNVAFSTRITATISCSFELQNYPMDSQECHLKIVSYAHTSREVSVAWFLNEPIRYRQSIGLPEFNLESIQPSYCNGSYKYAITEESHKTDSFSCLHANIRLKRSAAYHVIQSYIPSAFIVIISSVSFWLAIHARITLWFTTLLSLYTVSNSIKSNMPEVSCVKALDLYFGTCLLFIFCTLVEAAVVNSFMHKADKFERMAQSLALMTALNDSCERSQFATSANLQQRYQFQEELSVDDMTLSFYKNLDNAHYLDSPRMQELRIGYKYSRNAFHVDQFSRIIFPLVFSMFNLVYWYYFLSK